MFKHSFIQGKNCKAAKIIRPGDTHERANPLQRNPESFISLATFSFADTCHPLGVTLFGRTRLQASLCGSGRKKPAPWKICAPACQWQRQETSRTVAFPRFVHPIFRARSATSGTTSPVRYSRCKLDSHLPGKKQRAFHSIFCAERTERPSMFAILEGSNEDTGTVSITCSRVWSTYRRVWFLYSVVLLTRCRGLRPVSMYPCRLNWQSAREIVCYA